MLYVVDVLVSEENLMLATWSSQ